MFAKATMFSKVLAIVLAIHGNAAAALNLTVDLNYGVYQGVHDSSTGLRSWKGIRFAAPPDRWQAPQSPAVNRTLVVADSFGPRCMQALNSGTIFPLLFPGQEDCLFLNVYVPGEAADEAAPADDAGEDDEAEADLDAEFSATSESELDVASQSVTTATGRGLPVMVFIHGGGYGVGDGTQDFNQFLTTIQGKMVVVAIQYRLGALGFLSSPEINSRGVLNAGMLDQAFALRWVQKHIRKFGGDRRRVTIFGESSGGGSVLLQAMANRGNGPRLFKNGIAASPYTPPQYDYNAAITTARYYEFSKALGCPSSGNVFDCLLTVDMTTMENVNYNFSNTYEAIPFADWAFTPVTDGDFIASLPSEQLRKKNVNGVRMMTTQNANEGPGFAPLNITTQAEVRSFLKVHYPLLSNAQISALINAYPTPNTPDDQNIHGYETNGFGPGTAVNISQIATGHQQQAYNMRSEALFCCPSYWLASAYDKPGKRSYHYQYSVPFSSHSADFTSLFGPATENQPEDFNKAFRQIIANMVIKNNPSISNQLANGASSPNPSAPNPASSWPSWHDPNPKMLVLNTTGGTAYDFVTPFGPTVTQFKQPGLLNKFTKVDAYTWEGGRGKRCNLWRSLGSSVPE